MSQAGRGGRGPGGNVGASSGPGPSSGGGNDSTDGRGSNTPGAPSGGGRSGGTGGSISSSRDARMGGGLTAPSRDTPGAPDAPDGKRGSTMGPDGGVARGNDRGSGPGVDTPGSPDNPGRRGTVAGAGISARESARRARASLAAPSQARSNIAGDNDSQYGAGLGLEDAMDNQQTENTLNRRGITDTIGMSEVDRLGEARQGGAMLSAADRQKESGIRHGFGVQTMANRASDITGIPGVATTAASRMIGRPSNTMEADVDLGRERANQNEMGAGIGTATSLGMSKLGVNVPGNVASFGYAMASAAADDNMNALMGSPTSQSATNAGSGSSMPSISTSTANARAAMQPARQAPDYSAPAIDQGSYSRGLLSLAQKIR